MSDIPLIYTKKGNVPIAGLRYEKSWSVGPEFIVFTEEWFDAEELVKNNVHIYSVTGLPPIGGQQAVM